ncbi:MAG: excisionase family DNA-binding protein [Blastocatellia bacterium]
MNGILESETSQPADLIPSESDKALASESRSVIKGCLSTSKALKVRIFADGMEREVQIPMIAMRILTDALRHISKGDAVAILPLESEISTRQAAEILQVSHSYLLGLLENNEIPFRTVGSGRRVKLADALNYKKKTDEERIEALEELAAQAQELNMGY